MWPRFTTNTDQTDRYRQIPTCRELSCFVGICRIRTDTVRYRRVEGSRNLSGTSATCFLFYLIPKQSVLISSTKGALLAPDYLFFDILTVIHIAGLVNQCIELFRIISVHMMSSLQYQFNIHRCHSLPDLLKTKRSYNKYSFNLNLVFLDWNIALTHCEIFERIFVTSTLIPEDGSIQDWAPNIMVIGTLGSKVCILGTCW